MPSDPQSHTPPLAANGHQRMSTNESCLDFIFFEPLASADFQV